MKLMKFLTKKSFSKSQQHATTTKNDIFIVNNIINSIKYQQFDYSRIFLNRSRRERVDDENEIAFDAKTTTTSFDVNVTCFFNLFRRRVNDKNISTTIFDIINVTMRIFDVIVKVFLKTFNRRIDSRFVVILKNFLVLNLK